MDNQIADFLVRWTESAASHIERLQVEIDKLETEIKSKKCDERGELLAILQTELENLKNTLYAELENLKRLRAEDKTQRNSNIATAVSILSFVGMAVIAILTLVLKK